MSAVIETTPVVWEICRLISNTAVIIFQNCHPAATVISICANYGTRESARMHNACCACWWLVGGTGSNDPLLTYNNSFIDLNSGTSFTSCGHYSFGANSTPNNTGYRAQPHTTISDDGLICMFSSCMLLGTQASPGGEVETFLFEVPKVAG